MRCAICGREYDAGAVDGCERCSQRASDRLGAIRWYVLILAVLACLGAAYNFVAWLFGN